MQQVSSTQSTAPRPPRGLFRAFPDRDAAVHAARMAGLPAFFLGFLYVIGAFVGGLETMAVQGTVGAVLMVIGLLIRRGTFWLIPVVFVVVMLHALSNTIVALLMVAGVPLGQGIRTSGLATVLALICAFLLVNGVRALFWLRRNRSTTAGL